ncbi:hypothetical protein J6590_069541 [Homalodisca vitripennis]|nr:hypothetical protein J6590_069541 [Homalodisca vitripennis]
MRGYPGKSNPLRLYWSLLLPRRTPLMKSLPEQPNATPSHGARRDHITASASEKEPVLSSRSTTTKYFAVKKSLPEQPNATPSHSARRDHVTASASEKEPVLSSRSTTTKYFAVKKSLPEQPNATPSHICSRDSDQKCFRRVTGKFHDKAQNPLLTNLGKIKELLVTRSMEENYLDVDLATPWCGCYPSCNEIIYKSETITLDVYRAAGNAQHGRELLVL